jgi:hypothetical protein
MNLAAGSLSKRNYTKELPLVNKAIKGSSNLEDLPSLRYICKSNLQAPFTQYPNRGILIFYSNLFQYLGYYNRDNTSLLGS